MREHARERLAPLDQMTADEKLLRGASLQLERFVRGGRLRGAQARPRGVGAAPRIGQRIGERDAERTHERVVVRELDRLREILSGAIECEALERALGRAPDVLERAAFVPRAEPVRSEHLRLVASAALERQRELAVPDLDLRLREPRGDRVADTTVVRLDERRAPRPGRLHQPRRVELRHHAEQLPFLNRRRFSRDALVDRHPCDAHHLEHPPRRRREPLHPLAQDVVEPTAPPRLVPPSLAHELREEHRVARGLGEQRRERFGARWREFLVRHELRDEVLRIIATELFEAARSRQWRDPPYEIPAASGRLGRHAQRAQ